MLRFAQPREYSAQLAQSAQVRRPFHLLGMAGQAIASTLVSLYAYLYGGVPGSPISLATSSFSHALDDCHRCICPSGGGWFALALGADARPTQRDDGSWPMTSRPVKTGGEGCKSLIPITSAGSAWAILGLVRSR
jgi:hypothetical protein